MAYTPFALLAATLIVSMAFTTFETGHTVSEQGYTHSLKESWGRTQSYYALNSLRNLAEISTDSDVNNFSESMKSLLEEGRFGGLEVQETSYENWKSDSQNLSGVEGNLELQNLSVSVDNFTLATSSRLFYRGDIFGESFGLERRINISEVQDPLMEEIGLNYTIEACGFNNLALKLYTGDNYRGEARGEPLLRPNGFDLEEVSNPSDVIIFTSEIRQFDNETTSDFAGYVTLKEPPRPASYNNNFVTDAPYIPSFEEGQRAIIYEGLRTSNFHRMIRDDCYLSTAINEAPAVDERIEGEYVGESADGLFTLVDTDQVGTAEDKSNIGFQRVNGSGDLVSMHGITSGEGIVWRDFRVGESLSSIRGMGELAITE